MRLSVTDVCEVWMGATDLFTYNPQYVMVRAVLKQLQAKMGQLCS